MSFSILCAICWCLAQATIAPSGATAQEEPPEAGTSELIKVVEDGARGVSLIVGSEGAEYQKTMSFLASGKIPQAQSTLEALIERVEDPKLRVLAHYWLGEIFTRKRQSKNAKRHYAESYRFYERARHAQGASQGSSDLSVMMDHELQRAPEILMKLTNALLASGNKKDARVTFAQFKKEDIARFTPAQKWYYTRLKKRIGG